MNKTTPWTTTEENEALALRESHYTYAEIAKALKRSVRSVEKKFAKLRKLIPNPEWKTAPYYMGVPGLRPLTAEETEARCGIPAEPADRADFWKREAQRLQGVLSSQQHDKTAVDILVEKAVELAPIAYVPAKENMRFVGRKGGSSQSAVLLLSDCHVGQCVEAGQTLGFGNYNFDIFLRRLRHLERSIFSIVKDHTVTAVDEIVVAMLGDMLHGNLIHDVEAAQKSTLFSQFYSAGHALSQFLRNLSTLAPLRIHTVSGNHSRFSHQKKQPSDNRYSSFDFFLYAYMQALTRDIQRITWNIDKQPFAVFSVKDFVFQCSHGEELKGGDKALGVPNHSVGRRISATTQMRVMSGLPPINYYCTGHLHKGIELPHGMGDVLINGGFPGVDGYGLSAAFTPSRPAQRFFLMHPKFGRTASYKLQLDFGDGTPHGYTLPENFECR